WFMSGRSSELFTAAQKRIPGGVNSPVRAFRNVSGSPFFVSRAQGSKIWDVDGKEYIDYVGSWGPAILGHGPKGVVEAVRQAAARGLSFGIPKPLEVEVAELICDWMPSIEKVRMVNSGTEAAMSCIRLARAFTGRDKVIKFDGCYHGHVDALLVQVGSGALTHGQPGSAGVPQAFADLTISLPFNNAALLRKAFAENRGQIAAVIVEPVPANAGLYFPTGDLRRLAGWRVWRARRNYGQTFAARPGLSGRNVVWKSVGDGCGSGATPRARPHQWLETARRTRRAIRGVDARGYRSRKARCYLSSHRFDVLSVFHAWSCDRSGQRADER